MRKYSGLGFVSAVALAWASNALAADPLAVTLTPKADQDGQVQSLGVELRLPAPAITAGQALLRMPVHIVSTPTAAYSAEQISVTDAQGPLILTAVDEAPSPEGVYRQYIAQRAPVGDVTVRYSTAPRAVSSETRNGPLFDLRGQDGGLMGAGVYFFALPPAQTPYDITLNWDLSDLPQGARGVWSMGEGARTLTAPASALSFSFYAMGNVSSEPAQGSEDFALYWVNTPPFDIQKLADETRTLYGSMASFFNDANAPYRVFVRENPYPAGGGTALAQSFMFGYGAGGETTSGGLQMLLAHEMAHNWPRLTDDEHALTAWYTEGMAEYYSWVLAYQVGLVEPLDFLKIANDRAADYYANPHRNLSNADAGKLFWSDARAQRVPYGRGFMYLLNVNAQIRDASNGTRSLDDVVNEILQLQRDGQPAGLEQWVQIVTREIGPEAKAQFEAMVAGETLTPLRGTLSPCFIPHEEVILPWDLGFDEMRLGVVAQLRADSPAAKAGLKDGDEIVSMPSIKDVRGDQHRMIDMTVRRDGQLLNFSYLPRGEAIDGWQWQPVHDAERYGCLGDVEHGHAHE